MSMKDIFCQDTALAALRRAVVSGHVAGSYIFAGPEGVGKFTTAREWAKLLLCEKAIDNRREAIGAEKNPKSKIQNPKLEEACGECESCSAFKGGEHPDFRHIYKELLEFTKEGKGKTTPVALPIDVIREFLIEKVSQTPVISRRKVFVISEAEKLHGPAQNAMLKTLEEPPADTHIILLCTRLDNLLPTTLSRCQIVKFGPISEEKIIEKLAQRGIDAARARYWARFTDGSLGRAMWWSGLQLGEQDYYFVKRQLINRLAGMQLADVIELAQWIVDTAKAVADAWEEAAGQMKVNRSDINRMATKGLIYMAATAFSDASKVSSAGSIDKIVNADQRVEIDKIAGQFGTEKCAEIVMEAYKAMNWIEANVNEKLIVEDLLLGIGGCGIVGPAASQL